MEYKEGDFVRVDGRLDWYIAKIARLTLKQVILASGARYWKETGAKVGGTHWYQETISPATERDFEEVKKKRIAEQLIGFDFKSLPLSTLEEWLKTIQEMKK